MRTADLGARVCELWKVQEGANTREYRYDDNGNRTFVNTPWDSLGGTPGDIVYNDQDQLLKYGDTPFDYTAKGDLWHRYAAGGTTTYDYDALRALRMVRLPKGNVIQYVIDGRGRRVGKRVNGLLVQQWVYGRNLGPVAELDGSGAVRMRFVYASRVNVPDLVKTYPDGRTYRLYSDSLGSPRILYDIATAMSAKSFGFDEFGVRQGSPSGPLELPFGFAGGLYDPDTQLIRFGVRDYDPIIGRWRSKDPALFAGEQANLYEYAGSDPLNFSDLWGLRKWSDAEVRDMLDRYAGFLDYSPHPYLLMYEVHQEDGEFDFWAKNLNRKPEDKDTLELCDVGTMDAAQFGNFIAGFAAGHLRDPHAYAIVRIWGGVYHGRGALGGREPWGSIENFFDSDDSVKHIDLGLRYGLDPW